MSIAGTTFGEPAVTSDQRTIPFDYLFEFELLGERDRVVDRTVSVSIEAPFTAAGIGYGLVPVQPLTFGPDLESDFGGVIIFSTRPQPATPRALRDIPLSAVLTSLERALQPPAGQSTEPRRLPGDAAAMLAAGIRLNPDIAALVESGSPDRQFNARQLGQLFVEHRPVPEDFQFLYSVHDDGTGRAFQNEPILNTAGLGIANGDRPFRRFAVPITFAPRTTIRISVIELTDLPCRLHVALHGYRTLGGAGTPTGHALRVRRGRLR
jgi:hypothetical protein